MIHSHICSPLYHAPGQASILLIFSNISVDTPALFAALANVRNSSNVEKWWSMVRAVCWCHAFGLFTQTRSSPLR